MACVFDVEKTVPVGEILFLYIFWECFVNWQCRVFSLPRSAFLGVFVNARFGSTSQLFYVDWKRTNFSLPFPSSPPLHVARSFLSLLSHARIYVKTCHCLLQSFFKNRRHSIF